MQKIEIIAELGCVAVGKVERAQKLINLASDNGATIIKFQKRKPTECVPENLWDMPHPNPRVAWGDTYLSHRENIEFSVFQMSELKDYTEANTKATWSTSVFDITSALDMIELDPAMIKVPSACNTYWEMLDILYNEYKGDIHISLGMSNLPERQQIFDYLIKDNRIKRTVVYHCTSIYPCPFEKLHLLEIKELIKHCPRVGFSNHGKGIASDIAALTLGARYFERHFIDDRTFPHTDAPSSLEPTGLQKLARDLHNVLLALDHKADDIDDLELEQRKKLRNY